MSYTETQLYGDTEFRLAPDKTIKRAQEIHTLTQRWQAADMERFTLGAIPPDMAGDETASSDYAGMRIVEVEPDDEIPDRACTIRTLSEGILDGSPWLEIGLDERETEEGFDEISRTIFTEDPDAAQWLKGARIVETAITGVTGEADDDKLTKAAHGLTTGQLFTITFASGFTGLTSGGEYWAIVIDEDNIKAATSNANAIAGTAIDITGDGTDATITPVTIGYEYLFVCDRAKRKHRAAGYYELQLLLKGLKGTKPYKRLINGQAVESVSKFNGGVILSMDIMSGYPPVDSGSNIGLSGDSLEVEVFTPEVTVADTMIWVGDLPTDYIGIAWTPPDAPDVVIIDLSGSFEAEKYFWPSGWVCVSMPAEQLAISTATISVVTLNFAFRRESVPTRLAA